MPEYPGAFVNWRDFKINVGDNINLNNCLLLTAAPVDTPKLTKSLRRSIRITKAKKTEETLKCVEESWHRGSSLRENEL